MIGHIYVPALESKNESEKLPASLSHSVITEFLRRQLGFNGVVMTDDLMMGAITKYQDLGQAAVKAIAAGADQILVGGNSEQIAAVHIALMVAIANGEITETRLMQSASRIARAAIGPGDADQNQRIKKLEGCLADDNRVSIEIMQSAISLLRGTLPNLAQGHWNILVPDHPRYKLGLYGQLASAGFKNCAELRFPLDPPAEDRLVVIDKVKERSANCIILGFRSSIYTGQIELAKEVNQILADQGSPLYVVEVDAPSELMQSTEFKNVIATFDPSDAAIAALSRLLLKGF
jgi:hypothetical protein